MIACARYYWHLIRAIPYDLKVGRPASKFCSCLLISKSWVVPYQSSLKMLYCWEGRSGSIKLRLTLAFIFCGVCRSYRLQLSRGSVFAGITVSGLHQISLRDFRRLQRQFLDSSSSLSDRHSTWSGTFDSCFAVQPFIGIRSQLMQG